MLLVLGLWTFLRALLVGAAAIALANLVPDRNWSAAGSGIYPMASTLLHGMTVSGQAVPAGTLSDRVARPLRYQIRHL